MTKRFETRKVKNLEFDAFDSNFNKIGYTSSTGWAIWDNEKGAYVILTYTEKAILLNSPTCYSKKYITDSIVNQFNTVGPTGECPLIYAK